MGVFGVGALGSLGTSLVEKNGKNRPVSRKNAQIDS